MVLPDIAPGQRHREHITRPADPLPIGCPGQVVVAVPAWLLSRLRDELEDPLRPGRYLAAGADHAWCLLLGRHAPIQAPGQPSDWAAATEPDSGQRRLLQRFIAAHE